jgi:nitrite reductase/ring-hydroxylating ferredoxin subunit
MPHEHDIAGTGDLRPEQSMKFVLDCEGRQIEAFLINYRGTFHAYVNQCRHIPMTLDWVENQFFTQDGEYLLCATHGAYYAPDTGTCVAGPPCGCVLLRIPLCSLDGRILVRCPPEMSA